MVHILTNNVRSPQGRLRVVYLAIFAECERDTLHDRQGLRRNSTGRRAGKSAASGLDVSAVLCVTLRLEQIGVDLCHS
jgi:hypothetical protein